MSDLKPCPFCGGEGKLFHDTQSDYEKNWSYTVECNDCAAETAYTDTPDHAIALWNLRVSEEVNDGP